MYTSPKAFFCCEADRSESKDTIHFTLNDDDDDFIDQMFQLPLLLKVLAVSRYVSKSYF